MDGYTSDKSFSHPKGKSGILGIKKHSNNNISQLRIRENINPVQKKGRPDVSVILFIDKVSIDTRSVQIMYREI